MIRDRVYGLMLMMLIILVGAVAAGFYFPAGSCSLPPRPEWQLPYNASGQLVGLNRFFPNATDEWQVFFYRLDGQTYTIYALKQNCRVYQGMREYSFVVEGSPRNGHMILEEVVIKYNPGKLKLPDKPK